jgi:hypothetical protein
LFLRDAKFVMNVHGRWDESAQDKSCITWARGSFNMSAPFASAGAYVNFITGEAVDFYWEKLSEGGEAKYSLHRAHQ